MTRALLVIDVQESFRQGPLWPAISNPVIARGPGEPQLTKTSHNAFTAMNLQQWRAGPEIHAAACRTISP